MTTTNENTKKNRRTTHATGRWNAKAKEPMGCVEIVERALKTKMWTTDGKTPHATLYAAMTREIAKKGKAARFEKVERGLFRARTDVGHRSPTHASADDFLLRDRRQYRGSERQNLGEHRDAPTCRRPNLRVRD